MTFPVDTPNEEIQKQVLADEKSREVLGRIQRVEGDHRTKEDCQRCVEKSNL